MCMSAGGCQSTAQCSSCCTRPRARDSVRARVGVCISPLAARDRVAGILRARLGAFPLRSHRCVVPLLRGVEPWSLARPKQVSARRHLARLQSPAARRARRDRDGRSSRNTSCCCPPRGSALPGRGGQDAPSQARDPGRLARGQGKVRWTEAAPRRLRRTVAARAAPATPGRTSRRDSPAKSCLFFFLVTGLKWGQGRGGVGGGGKVVARTTGTSQHARAPIAAGGTVPPQRRAS